jgi:formiminotetrahydrofolate cyclodeaminase
VNESFLESLSKAQPIPGGGSASAYGASVGLALLEKIVRLELNRYATLSDRRSFWDDLLSHVKSLAGEFNELRDEDGRAYTRLVEAKASGGSEDDLNRILQDAIECPMQIMKKTFEAFTCVSQAAAHCKGHLLPDLLVVCELLEAGGRGAYHIAFSNLLRIGDDLLREEYQQNLDQLIDQSYGTFLKTETDILERRAKTLEKKVKDDSRG